MAGQVLGWLAWAVASAVLGHLSARLAVAYARRIGAGARVNAQTFMAALRCTVWPRRRRASAAAAPAWAQLGHAQTFGCMGLVALAGLPWVADPGLLALVRQFACAVLVVLALIDARTGYLPDALTLPLLWGGLLLAWAGYGVDLHDAVGGAVIGYACLWSLNAGFQCVRRRPGLGGGDMKLVAGLGAWLGWAALPEVVLAACLGGLAWVVARLGRQAWHASLAFGPFLALAGVYGMVGTPVVQFLFCMGNAECIGSG